MVDAVCDEGANAQRRLLLCNSKTVFHVYDRVLHVGHVGDLPTALVINLNKDRT